MRLLLCTTFLFLSIIALAQEDYVPANFGSKSKLVSFQKMIWSGIWADQYYSPIYSYNTVQWTFTNNGLKPLTRDEFYQVSSKSLITIGYGYRVNIWNMTSGNAFSFSIEPSISASMVELGIKGFGHFNLPIFINYEMGNGAVSTSLDNKLGYFLGVGLEYNHAGLIKTFEITKSAENKWFLPVIQGGFRFLNQKGKLNEFSAKVGYMEVNSNYIFSNNRWVEQRNPFSFRISYNYYIAGY